jgi:tetratricopeptide (TPR) repeat protein
MTRRTIAVALLTLAIATAAQASWYDDYDAGLIAAKKGAWSTVVSKMTEAIADLERTSGPGPENLGSIESLMDRAKKMAAASNEPEPAPAPRNTPAPVVTPPAPTPTPVPVVPQIDPVLRQRASAALASAKQKLQSAQQRRATQSPQYAQAMSTYTDATTRSANARNNDDLNTVISLADNAGDFADLAQPPNVPAPIAPTPTPTPGPIVPRPVAATTQVIDEHADDVKRALEQYFAGEFEEAAQRFERLTNAMPNNGWIYAFLGASQYSLYAFEADESYRRAAINSFRKAKQLRTWRDGLPQKYFSKRIRDAFREEG